VLETLRKYLRNLIIEIKYFEIHPTLKKKQFYLDVFGFFIMACFGGLFIFVIVVIAIIGRNIIPEKQWNWIETHFLTIWKYVTDKWKRLW
jgi:hypothetical protein